jgi:guanine deaminase
MAGFIDAHIHFPQYRMLAAPGRDLLDWLNRFTFPEEARYASRAHAAKAAGAFLGRLIANGTTAALCFSSVHKVAADALFAAAESRGMAIATGKTMMDRNCPPGVRDDPESGYRDSAALIAKWHARGRARYAITPRFAITSSEAQLEAAGALAKAHPGCLVQTHLSEQPREIETVSALYPWAKHYTHVYDRFGLLGPRSLFAHGIHLNARERARLAATGSSVVHCPTSNSFLGSGIMPFSGRHRGTPRIAVALGTDVGGGTSYSMLATMAEAYRLQMLAGYRASATELFHLATLGNAERLHMAHEAGSLAPGKWADVVVLDPAATSVLAARHALSKSLEDVLFALMILGDDRAVRATYVSGVLQPAEKP